MDCRLRFLLLLQGLPGPSLWGSRFSAIFIVNRQKLGWSVKADVVPFAWDFIYVGYLVWQELTVLWPNICSVNSSISSASELALLLLIFFFSPSLLSIYILTTCRVCVYIYMPTYVYAHTWTCISMQVSIPTCRCLQIHQCLFTENSCLGEQMHYLEVQILTCKGISHTALIFNCFE